MPRTFYTIDDLFQFCKTNNFAKFNAKEHDGKPLIVQSFETFAVEANSNDGLLPVFLKACHIGRNRNKSFISEDNMNKYKNTFKGRPILGAIHKTDTGEYEFHAHDIKVVDDGDGEQASIEYIEQPIGVISEINEPYLEYDEEEDKTYLIVKGNVFEDYSRAAEILRRRKTCKCSVEIAVNEMSWNAQEECLSIEDFSFRGVTILGYEQDGVTEIAEGMKGSKISIDDFSMERNSIFSADYQMKLLETLDKLNVTLSKFSINDATKKGVENEDMNHFEELLGQYGITEEDINFEVEGLSDEELDVAFEEHFAGCKTKKKCDADGDSTGDEAGDDANVEGEAEAEADVIADNGVDNGSGSIDGNGDGDDEAKKKEDDFAGCKKKRRCSLDDNGNVTIEYELSHDDIRAGLYALLREESNDDYFWPWIIDVYDDRFIYSDEETGKFYKRNYSVDGDNISFDGDPIEVFNEWLTQAERDALDSLKQNYTELKQFKEQYDSDIIKANKNEIFNRNEYIVLANNKQFIDLKSNADNFSVEEVEMKCKEIFADYVIANGKFNLADDDAPKASTKKIGLNFSKSVKKKPYGNLFHDEK